MCFARVPPEINSGRMFNGAGSGSMVQAAEAWGQLAASLRETSAYCRAVTVQLSQGWQGTVAVAVTYKMAGYLGWLDIAAEHAARAAAQARTAAHAHWSVVAALASPDAIIINRARLVVLAATNYLGQASAAIADTEAEYEQMWVTDSAAMYAYARASADASTLAALNSPVVTADLTESVHQGERDRRSSWALESAPDVISAGQHVVQTLPKVMRALSSPQTTLDVHVLSATASLSMLSSLSPPSAVANRNLNSLNKAAMILKSVVSTAAGSRKRSSEGPTALGFGVRTSIGTLSVPRRWVVRTTPATDAVELQSDWVRGPIRLVHAAGAQQVRDEDRSERSETRNHPRRVNTDR
jgi:PPE-repeat protein